jgi:nucleoid-associated protein YgaU
LYFSNTEYPWEAVYSWNFVSKSDSSKQTVFEVLNLFTEHEIFGQTNSSSEYIVVEGDNLGVIAEKIYNNPDAWTVLVMDNEDYLSQTNGKVSTGMKLKIRYEFKENE